MTTAIYWNPTHLRTSVQYFLQLTAWFLDFAGYCNNFAGSSISSDDEKAHDLHELCKKIRMRVTMLLGFPRACLLVSWRYTQHNAEKMEWRAWANSYTSVTAWNAPCVVLHAPPRKLCELCENFQKVATINGPALAKSTTLCLVRCKYTQFAGAAVC